MIAWPKHGGARSSRGRASQSFRQAARARKAAGPRDAGVRARRAKAVLDDDHRTVDDQAEVERAEAHQVSRHPERLFMPIAIIRNEEGITSTAMIGGTPVAEQQEQYRRDQDRAFGQVAFDRLTWWR